MPEIALGELVNLHNAARRPIKATDRSPGATPYYGASGIVDYVDGFTHDGHLLLVSEDGENLRSRSTPVAFEAIGPMWVNNHAHVLSGKQAWDTRFLKYAIASIDISGYLTGSAQPKLTQSALLSIRLPDLSAEERKAIAEVLGALDDKIAANGTIEQRTRNLLTAHFEALGFDIEPTQDSCTLDTLIEINPRTASPAQGEATYLDMKNLPDRALTVRKWSQRLAKGGARFQNGDTLLARITPCLENGKVGYVDFLRGDEVGVGSTEFIVLRSRPGLPAALPYFFATSERFREHAIRHMSGTTGRQRLAAADVGAYLVQPPSPEALGQFGELASSLVPMLRRLVDQSERLAATRDELLPLLMSGGITVRDLEEVAEAVT